MEKATFTSRLLAWLVDMVGIGIVSSIISWIADQAAGLSSSGNLGGFGTFTFGWTSILLGIVAALAQFLYFGYMWSRSDGQSFGMKMVDIRVVDRTTNSSTGFVTAGLRGWFGYWLSGLIFGLGYIWAAFDDKGEAWHDKIFNTHVVKA